MLVPTVTRNMLICNMPTTLWCFLACRQEVIDGLFRKSGKTGRLKLVAKKPVVLVLGTGWGAHSLVKVMGLTGRAHGGRGGEQMPSTVCFSRGALVAGVRLL